MNELYMDDSDFTLYCEQIMKIDKMIESRLNKIIEQVNIATTGVSAGDFHTNLVAYANKLSVLQGQLSYFTLELITEITNFSNEIKMIDVID